VQFVDVRWILRGARVFGESGSHLWKRRPCQARKDKQVPFGMGRDCQGRPQGVHLDPWQALPVPIIERGTKRNEVQLSFVP